MPTALCNNAKLYYETDGRGGSPVLLIMGLGAQGAAWGFQRPDSRVMLAQLLTVLRHDTAARLPSLAGLPTLIFKPEHDVLVRPEQSDRLHDLIPGSTLVSLPDTGHAAMMQGADLINPRLLDHFAAADAG